MAARRRRCLDFWNGRVSYGKRHRRRRERGRTRSHQRPCWGVWCGGRRAARAACKGRRLRRSVLQKCQRAGGDVRSATRSAGTATQLGKGKEAALEGPGADAQRRRRDALVVQKAMRGPQAQAGGLGRGLFARRGRDRRRRRR